MAKFINPFTDVGFKIIFGQEFPKPVLLAFLNFGLAGLRREFRTDVALMDMQRHELFTDKMRLTLL